MMGREDRAQPAATGVIAARVSFRFFQASSPPSRGRTFPTPIFLSWSATRALEASLGHVQ
jgi:hypothetical protein